MDDLVFAQKCTKADKPSWNEFVDRYSRLIYRYIHSVLKNKGTIVAEEDINDLFQEIFFLLVRDNFKKLKTFTARNGCSLASWLRQVTVNYTIDYLRKFKINSVSLDQEDEEGFSLKDILPDKGKAITEAISDKELREHLKECITALETEDKYFLELHLNQGLALENLREHFRISRGAVDMRKSRIIQRLKECFKSKGFWLDF